MGGYEHEHKIQYEDEESKQGSKCCGFCCDMRRAVIILNIIFLILSLISTIFSFTGRELFSQAAQEVDEYDLSAYEDVLKWSGIITAVGCVFHLIGIVGAVKYNVVLLGLCAVWYIASFVADSILSGRAVKELDSDNADLDLDFPVMSVILSGIFTAIYVYPHVALIGEIKNGIMSPETYKREEHSCCCV